MEEQKNKAASEGKDINFAIALYYTGGDEQCAREMLEGKYRDLYIIKASFQSSSLAGAFLLFYNIKHLKLVDVCVYVTSGVMSPIPDSAALWWEFEKTVTRLIREGEQDHILVRTLRDGIIRSFTKSFIADLNRFLENEDDISLNRLVQKVVQDALGLQRLEMKVMATNTTSLEMEQKSITTRKIDPQNLETQKLDAAGKARPLEESSKSNVPRVGVDGVKLILKSSFILSPIKGKDITKLQVGDRVRINIIDKNPKAVAVAKAFNAYDEQNQKFLPVNARIRQIEKTEGKGIEAYALLAKGIIAHIIEEEENIKVAMDPNYVWQSEEEEKSPVNITAIIIIMLIIAICTAVVIALIKLL